MKIKHRITGEVILRVKETSLSSLCLRNADLRNADFGGADLRGADLRNADLRGADLSDADLCGANLGFSDLRGADLRGACIMNAKVKFCSGDSRVIRTMQINEYTVVVCDDLICIGCECHRAHEWLDFSNKTIIEMHGSKALKWWRLNKSLVFNFLDSDGNS